MPRNGSGSYNLPTNSWNPAINSVSATPADWQTLVNDVAAAIQASVASDGQTPMSGNLAMGGYRLTGAGAPSGAGMSLRWEQLIQGADIPSAAAITIPLEGQLFAVTGTTAITSIAATIPGRLVYLKFDAGIVLTNSTSLIMPSGVNVTTLADDVAVFLSLSSGVWKCVYYPRKSVVSGANDEVVVQSQVLGIGQTWQDVTASRALNTNYTNSTGRPIQVCARGTATQQGNSVIAIAVDGVTASTQNVYVQSAGFSFEAQAIVPAGSVYKITAAAATLLSVSELR